MMASSPPGVSAAALLIAKALLYVKARSDAGFLVADDAHALWRAAIHCAAPASRFPALVGSRLFRGALAALDRLVAPGLFLHYAARKRSIEDAAATALRRGADGAVALAAGFDPLLARLCRRFPSAAFIEADAAATQRLKRATLAHAEVVPGNLHLVASNLAEPDGRNDVAARAAAVGLRDAVVIAEGITMYLGSDDVDELFRLARRLCGMRGMFVFTFMVADRAGRIGFRGRPRIVDSWLRRRSEPFRWGARTDQIGSLLRAHGFRLDSIIDHRDLRRTYLAGTAARDLALAEGEAVCLAAPAWSRRPPFVSSSDLAWRS